MSSTKTRWASTAAELPAFSVSGPATLRTTTSSGLPVSPAILTALSTTTASETAYRPGSTQMPSPSSATSTACAIVANGASRVVPALASLPDGETYQSNESATDLVVKEPDIVTLCGTCASFSTRSAQ